MSFDELGKEVDQVFDDHVDALMAGTDGDLESIETPAASATLTRTDLGYLETMTINGYPWAKTIVVTIAELSATLDLGGVPTLVHLPGVVRELPVGFRSMASSETFMAAVEAVVAGYIAQGWVRA